ncbi:MDR family MFS transporter [Demequina sp. SYSU T00b26]|uniref:MDR family MFS transporter n=2 Tax=Demequina zhanjiangensis TaxID=3051659 RepID=A0ABT8G1J6_9MICO|nr:MDR family MFS transporter [Demequina sp. SYSU T00b26]MDN4472947.1 MDR family MFS transporter [Demequina sp. SYSU T00b26]
MLGMFVSMLASTVVSSSLPLIVAELGGSQTSYTWVVTATLLATAVSTPLWGKFADLANRKVLFQAAISLFIVASLIAGFAGDVGVLIAARTVQGIGAGGLAALSQIIMADIVSPRERGRYAGLFGGVMAVATVGGPLLGGVVTDTFGWRWNFFIAAPVAIIALVMIQLTLHLPHREPKKVSIDYWGIALISAGVSTLLIWVTLAGSQFAWASTTSYVMVGAAAALLIGAVVVELVVPDPLIPLDMFKDRTFTFAVIGSAAIGVTMFGTSVFLAQYMQLSHGATPTQSGLLTIPMMGGLLIASTTFGQVISRTGKWKAIMVSGATLAVIGSSLLGTIDADTSLVQVGISMFILGAGVGMLMQNLVLVVQNRIEVERLGVATSTLTFFRTIGGTIGVSLLGVALANSLPGRLAEGFATLSAEDQADAARLLASGSVPEIAQLPDSIASVVEHAYGAGIGHVFLLSVPLAIVAFVAVSLLPNARLGTQTAIEAERQAAQRAAEAGALESELVEAELGLAAVGAVPSREAEADGAEEADRP